MSRLTHFAAFASKRPYMRLLAATVSVLCLIVGLSIGITTVSQDYRARLAMQRDATFSTASLWSTRLSSHIAQAVSLSTSCGAFASALAQRPANVSANASQRMVLLADATWRQVAESMFRGVSGMLTLQLQSGGVISQTYPDGTAPIGLDLLAIPAERPDVLRLADSGGASGAVTGPLPLVQGGFGFVARSPVYVGVGVRNLTTWWGNGAGVFRVTDMLESLNFSVIMRLANLQWTLTATAYDGPDGNVTSVQMIASSSAGSVGGGGVATVRFEQIDPIRALELSVWPTGGFLPEFLPADLLSAAILGSLAAAILVPCAMTASMFAVWLFRHRHVPPVAFTSRRVGEDESGHSADGGAEGNSREGMTPLFVGMVAMKGALKYGRLHPAAMARIEAAFPGQLRTLAAECGCHVGAIMADCTALVVANQGDALATLAVAVQVRLAKELSNTAPCPDVSQRVDLPVPSARSSLSRNGTSRQLQIALPPEFSVAVHWGGPIAGRYDAGTDTVSFSGHVAGVVAVIVDATVGFEVAWTSAFEAHAPEAIEQALLNLTGKGLHAYVCSKVAIATDTSIKSHANATAAIAHQGDDSNPDAAPDGFIKVNLHGALSTQDELHQHVLVPSSRPDTPPTLRESMRSTPVPAEATEGEANRSSLRLGPGSPSEGPGETSIGQVSTGPLEQSASLVSKNHPCNVPPPFASSLRSAPAAPRKHGVVLEDEEGKAAAAVVAFINGDMQRRRVAVAVVEMGNSSSPVGTMQTAESTMAMLRHARDLAISRKGAMVAIWDSRIVVAFNAQARISNAAEAAASFVEALRDCIRARKDGTVDMVAGIASGYAYTGTNSGVLYCVGAVMRLAWLLVEAAGTISQGRHVSNDHDAATLDHSMAALWCPCLVSRDAQEEVASAFEQLSIAFDERGEIVSLLQDRWASDQEAAGDNEWLYVLEERLRNSKYARINAAFEAAEAADWHAVEEQLQGLSMTIDATGPSAVALRALRQRLADKNGRPR